MTGRRALAVCLATVLTLAFMVPAVLAAGVTSASDSFDEPIHSGYSGGSGWNGNWTETGESTSPSSGAIQVVSSGCELTNCVQFSAILSVGVGLQRSANFEGAEKVSLTFRYRKAGVGDLQVQARTGSGSWQTVSNLGNRSAYTNATVDLSDYASPTMQIMFFSTVGLLSSAYIDNVSITASYPTTTTSTTTTTTTTTSSTSTTTTTTAAPIITLPTIPPILSTTTTTASAGSSTTTTVSSSTTTTTGGSGTSTTTTTTAPPGSAGGTGPKSSGPGPSSGDGDQATVNPPLTEEELDFAAESNIVVNLAGGGDFGGFEPGIGINPMTDLWVNLNTTVEAITTEILNALALGAMIAFFGVRRIKDDEGDPS